MSIYEQVVDILNNDTREQKDIADAAGLHPVTISKLKKSCNHLYTNTLISVLGACGYELKAVPSNNTREKLYSEMCDQYCRFPRENISQHELNDACASCPLNKL